MIKNQCLEIKIGDEYLSKVECIENFEKSFFSEIYLKAFKSIEEIVKNNAEKEKVIDYENYNNIIAFTGERGTGKTSAMLSVAEALKSKDSKENKNSNFMKENSNFNLDGYKFLGLKVIDPSHFQKNSNIIEIILAKMFESFKKLVEENEDKKNGKKREVLENFEKVFKDIKIISKGGGADGEAIDALLNMSASSNLKGNLEKLIKSYLEFVGPEEKRKILVLEIDDLDLNTKYGYKMIEQIRKYLIIKNVVILMAVKIEQLSLVIEKNTRKEFKELIEAGQIGNEKINLMSDKYLKKLIPLERRLYMPELEIKSESKMIKIINKDKNGKLKESEEEIIDKKVRSLIYHKTGMEFIDGKYIVPNNLRDLINIVSFLEKIPDLKEEDNDKKTMTNNFLLWKEYIFEIWIKKYLSINQQQILKELYERDIEEKNKYIINKIEGLYELLRKDDKFRIRRENNGKPINSEKYTNSELEYQDIINLNNNPKNICLGDVLFVLDKVKKYKVELQDQRFICAIKMVYSIMLSEIYDINEYEEEVRIIKESFDKKISKEKLEQKLKILKEIFTKKISDIELEIIKEIFNKEITEGEIEDEVEKKIRSGEENKEIVEKLLIIIKIFEKNKFEDIFEEEITEEKIKKKLKGLINFSNYKKLLGGYLYHLNTKQFMRGLNSGTQEETTKRIPRDRMVVPVKEIVSLNSEFNETIKELTKVNENKGLGKDELFKFFDIFRIKTNKIYYKKTIRLEKEIFGEKINIEELKDGEKIEFDVLGFLYNVKKGDFYIRNIEILENIFNRNYQGSTSTDFLDHLILFKDYYKEEIKLGFSGGTINLFKEKDTITFIEKVVNILDENENLKKEFNKLMSSEKKIDIKLIKESLLELKKGDEFVQKQALKKFIKAVKEEIGNGIKDTVSRKKSKEILDKLEEIKYVSFINYYDKNGALSGEGEKVYGKKSEIIEKHIKVLKDYFKAEGTEE